MIIYRGARDLKMNSNLRTQRIGLSSSLKKKKGNESTWFKICIIYYSMNPCFNWPFQLTKQLSVPILSDKIMALSLNPLKPVESYQRSGILPPLLSTPQEIILGISFSLQQLPWICSNYIDFISIGQWKMKDYKVWFASPQLPPPFLPTCYLHVSASRGVYSVFFPFQNNLLLYFTDLP